MMFPIVHGLAKGPETLFQIIETAGLTTNLKICLDAGDVLSYSGSGQKWLDRSAAGSDFFLGADINASTDDPTFTGNAGGLTVNDYWNFDAGDFFRYDSVSETWMNALHKDNAVFTILSLIRPTGTGVSRGICGNAAGIGSNNGIEYDVDLNEKHILVVGKSVAGNALVATSDADVTLDAWHMLALSIDEPTGAGGGFFYKDGAYDQVSSADTFNATYDAPSSANASFTLEVAALGDATIPFRNNDRMACFALWGGRALTKAELDLIWLRIRGRFGI